MPESDVLGLRAGEWIEVRSEREILSMLDQEGKLDKLPFMPEMLQYCGRRLRVSKRADKTCDPAHTPWSMRRVKDAVHLEGVRCDGSEHGGCEAGCLVFWKEAWLKRTDPSMVAASSLLRQANENTIQMASGCGCTVDCLVRSSRWSEAEGEDTYACQATDIRNYTTHLPWWDLRQYLRDISSGNLSACAEGCTRPVKALEKTLEIWHVVRVLLIEMFNRVQQARHNVQYPTIEGRLQKTPLEVSNLQSGELVQVRTKEEILETLDTRNRNRGLLFDVEMLRYCGGIYRILRRVHRIIDEGTGKMLRMKSPCIVLEGVVCQSEYHRLCPRAIYAYWRENWLQRVSDMPLPSEPAAARDTNHCESVTR